MASNSGGGGNPIKIQVVQQQPPSQVIQFPLLTAGAGPNGISLGGDMNYWVTEGAVGKIARVTDTGTVTEFPFTHALNPTAITAGGTNAKYAVWTVDSTDAIVSQITPTGIDREIQLATGSAPQGIDIDSGGNGWVSIDAPESIAKITTAGVVTMYPLPTGSAPSQVQIGPDKNVWVAEPGIGSLAQLVPGTGVITQFPLPAGRTPMGLSSGGSYLYIGESTASGGLLGRMTTAGALTEFTVPGGAVPDFLIGAGPLTSTWFASSSSQLEYATLTAKTKPFTTVAAMSAPVPIIQGKDNNIWYPDAVCNCVDIYVVYPIFVTDSSISFTAVPQTQTFSVSETHYTGTFYVTSSNGSVAMVSPASGTAATTFTVTANGPGTANITVSDNSAYPKSGNGTNISVTVTTTTIGIN